MEEKEKLMQQLQLSPDPTEKRILALIDAHRDEIVAFGRDVFTHAELGYKEFRTAAAFAGKLKGLGLDVQEGVAVTGVKGNLRAADSKATVALIGELDAVKVKDHPARDTETNAAHACGHHAQLTGVIGAAIALSDPEVRKTLGGNVVFFGVPAEEYGEVGFKRKLMDEGKIGYGGGKCELIRIGAFDDIDVSVAHHTMRGDAILVGSGSNTGFVTKLATFKGRAVHAANAPHRGINALNAASLALQAIGMQRETFRDEDSVRVHPILTKGGDLVNVVPDEAVLETLVRAGNVEAIEDTSRKVDACIRAGCDAIGAGYVIETMPGYLPVLEEAADEALVSAALLASGDYQVKKIPAGYHTGGSTDIGDLQHVQPVLRFTTYGMRGDLHAADFAIVDEELDYIVTAKVFALTAYRLLRDNAKKALAIKKSYKPKFTREEYVAFWDSLTAREVKPRMRLPGEEPDPKAEKPTYIPRVDAITEVRKASRQYAMLYFHFCKALVDQYGIEAAKKVVQQAVFEQGVDRASEVRKKCLAKGMTELGVREWQQNWDLAFLGWVREYGRDYCPYAKQWVRYYEKYPWFREFAPFYCDIIDTTVIEAFSHKLTHKITGNLVKGDARCDRTYWPSKDVEEGRYTYGTANDGDYRTEYDPFDKLGDREK